MNESQGKWKYNYGDDEIWNATYDYFDTREEAIKEGNFAAIDADYEYYKVGQIEFSFKPHIDAERILAQIGEDAYQDSGEVAGDYLAYVPDDESNELERMLNETLNNWLTKTNNHPTFYNIINTSDHEVIK